MGNLLSNRDMRRIEAAVRDYENRVRGSAQIPQNSKRFFSQNQFRMFKVLAAARPPESIDDPRAVIAQPFLGDSRPELAWDSPDEPVQEIIYHSLPGLHLCKDTIVWCLWAYSEWRIIHAEQWPVSVQQLRADGFPLGQASCQLIIANESLTFFISGNTTAGELLEQVREHPQISAAEDVQAIGGPLHQVDINLMFGPRLSGKEVQPLLIDSSSLNPAGSGIRVAILSPLWAVS